MQKTGYVLVQEELWKQSNCTGIYSTELPWKNKITHASKKLTSTCVFEEMIDTSIREFELTQIEISKERFSGLKYKK